MENEYDPWAMFHSTDMGNNLEGVVEIVDCKVLRMKDPSGDGLMTIYQVFDGVYLMYNDFHMTHCYSRFHSSARIFCMDKGYFEELGLNVEFYMFSNGAGINEALAAQEIDVGVSGLAMIFSLASGTCKMLAEGQISSAMHLSRKSRH